MQDKMMHYNSVIKGITLFTLFSFGKVFCRIYDREICFTAKNLNIY